jgi:L-fucose isomerase-like protein
VPEDPAVRDDLITAIRVAAAHAQLRQGSVGLVGTHAPGFSDMHADPVLLSDTFGLQLVHADVTELVDRMAACVEDEVADDVARTMALGLPLAGVEPDDLPPSSRYVLAMKAMMRDGAWQALAVREWPELPNLTGQWPYLAMARLLSGGVAVACEGDVDGAVSLLCANLLGCGPCYLSDWLEHDADTITLWHAGNPSFNLCVPAGQPDGLRLGLHFNNQKPLVVDGDLRAGEPLTVFRLWHCDGAYHAMAAEGMTLQPRRPLLGTNGLLHLDDRDVRQWFGDLVHAGMPHHVAVLPGHCAGLLRRFTRHFSLDWVGGAGS